MPHTSISPMLSVRRGARAIDFYVSAFGAEVVYRVDASDGAVVARLSADGAEFWVADESPEHKNFSPETLAGGTVRMVMIVDNPDAVLAKAVAAGATAVWPVGDQHGWRVGRVVDPFGHPWEIGKPLSSPIPSPLPSTAAVIGAGAAAYFKRGRKVMKSVAAFWGKKP